MTTTIAIIALHAHGPRCDKRRLRSGPIHHHHSVRPSSDRRRRQDKKLRTGWLNLLCLPGGGRGSLVIRFCDICMLHLLACLPAFPSSTVSVFAKKEAAGRPEKCPRLAGSKAFGKISRRVTQLSLRRAAAAWYKSRTALR